MKRLRDASIEKSAKRTRLNPTADLQQQPSPWESIAEPALWEQIMGHLNGYQRLDLLSTTKFFTSTLRDNYKQQIFLEVIKTYIFDYPNESELNIDLPIDAVGFNQLKNYFVNELKDALPGIEALQYKQEIVKHFNPLLEDGFHDGFELLEEDTDNFLNILCTAIREGNLLILKELKQTLPFFMKHCIDALDQLEMTPFAHAAANDREKICNEILDLNVDPFQRVIHYDLGAAFVFSMRSIHVLALRSNKNFLITIFDQYLGNLTAVFEKNYQKALLDILNNKVESLKKRLDEDDALLKANDYASWTLVQWASCFPDSIDCLQLLLDKKAAINGDESPPVAYIACATGNQLALQKLIATGESIEPLENGNSLLHLSVYLGHYEIAEMLITDHKLDVNAANERDETPLALASYSDHNGMELSSVKLARKMLCFELLLNNNATEDMNNPYLA